MSEHPAAQRDTREDAGNRESLSEVLEAARIGWWIWDIEADTMSWSENLDEIYGLAPGTLGSAQEFRRPVHPDDRATVQAAIDRAVRDGNDYDAVFRVVPPAGPVQWINDRGRVLRRNGKPVRMIATSMNVSEAEREQERTRSLFLASLGHDLRNPLNTITVSLYSLQKHVPESLRHVVSRMLGSAGRMSRMIEQLLDFTRARLTGVGIALEPRPGDLSEIARSVVDEMEGGDPGRFRLVPNGALGGLWDADRLAQVFANLLSNALDHGAPGQAIEMTLAREGGHARVEVRNGGEPIPPDLCRSIFEPFNVGTKKFGSKARGLGLGLYITREIVRSHGGDVEVRSSESQTVFTVTLPIRPIP